MAIGRLAELSSWPSAAQRRGPGTQSDCLRNTPLGSGSPVGRPEMWCMTQTPSPEFQTAAHDPAPRLAGFWKVSHQTEKLFDFSDKFDAQKYKGPEHRATTSNINRTRSPSVPARHFTVPNFRASTGCFSSKPLRHPIPSLRWQTGRNAGRADSRSLCASPCPKSLATFGVDAVQLHRRNRPGRASSVETRAGGTARRPPIKTAHDRPLAWTAMGGLWERFWGGG